MKCFLTSSPVIMSTGEINPANSFKDRLISSLPENCPCLFVCSDPSSFDMTDHFSASVRKSLVEAGVSFGRFLILDSRNASNTAELITKADFIILAGGHVPTQNKFFSEISLKEHMALFKGTLMGISAGSMNSAEVVYSQPELEGEASDPNYKRFLTGLGLTRTMILPHYNDIKRHILDGMRIIEDITFPDSQGRKFLAIPDGSYLYIENGKETVFGEAYLISDGKISHISSLSSMAEI